MFFRRISLLPIAFYIVCLFFEVRTVKSDSNHVVSLQYKNQHFCTGSIIRPHVILTAANCFVYTTIKMDFNDIRIYAGTIERIIAENTTKAYYIKKVVVHSEYKPREKRSDVAVVTLTEDIANEIIKDGLAKLSYKRPKTGTVCSLMGWNRLYRDGPMENHLVSYQLVVLNDSACAVYAHYYAGHICLGPVGGSNLGYQGDYGSMLICNKEQKGIGQFRFMDMFYFYVVDVSRYRNWILVNNAVTTKVAPMLIFMKVLIEIFL